MTNEALIQLYTDGDNDALKALFMERGYENTCLAIALNKLKDVEDAQDAVSEVRADLLEKSTTKRKENHADRPEAQFRAFVHTMVRNKAVDIIRKRNRQIKRNDSVEKKVPAQESVPYERLEEIRDMVRDCARKSYTQKKDRASWPMEDLQFLDVCLEVGPRDLRAVANRAGIEIDDARKKKQRLKRHLLDCPRVGPFLKLIF